MKTNQAIIDSLNERLSEEISAVSQYMIHAEMLANWGFDKLHEAIEKHAMDEMHHAKWLIERILFLDGNPTVKPVHLSIATDIPSIIKHGLIDELDAVEKYNQTIAFALEQHDNGTRDLMAKILNDEEHHVDWGEMQETMMTQMGLETYLNTQV